jgi:redox-regulated HSP33 family molecular chaperone
MKRIAFAMICFAIWASVSSAEEWEGKEILIEQRNEVISACEKGVASRGFPEVKVQKYCKCSVDYMTEIATTYTKEEINRMAETKGRDFIEKEVIHKCKHFLE